MEIVGKFNGATGNYNAHIVAFPNISDWEAISRSLVIDKLGLSLTPYSTQIESHDFIAELSDSMTRFNTITIGLARDMWGYISLGYFKQLTVAGEVGSSTMPHKVNPIDFENCEGQLGLSSALFTHLSQKLPISRYQRDLTDSTVLRSLGNAFGHSVVALNSLKIGLNKIEPNQSILDKDLNDNWEILGEAIQTVMRKYSVEEPYEKLKLLTRGKKVDKEVMKAFIDSEALKGVPEEDKERLRKLTPQTYIGLAAKLAKKV